MAVEWTITIEGKNEFGDICRKEVRIDKRWERLFDGDLGLSIEDETLERIEQRVTWQGQGHTNARQSPGPGQ